MNIETSVIVIRYQRHGTFSAVGCWFLPVISGLSGVGGVVEGAGHAMSGWGVALTSC